MLITSTFLSAWLGLQVELVVKFSPNLTNRFHFQKLLPRYHNQVHLYLSTDKSKTIQVLISWENSKNYAHMNDLRKSELTVQSNRNKKQDNISWNSEPFWSTEIACNEVNKEDWNYRWCRPEVDQAIGDMQSFNGWMLRRRQAAENSPSGKSEGIYTQSHYTSTTHRDSRVVS